MIRKSNIKVKNLKLINRILEVRAANAVIVNRRSIIAMKSWHTNGISNSTAIKNSQL